MAVLERGHDVILGDLTSGQDDEISVACDDCYPFENKSSCFELYQNSSRRIIYSVRLHSIAMIYVSFFFLFFHHLNAACKGNAGMIH